MFRKQMKGRVATGRRCERALYADQTEWPARLQFEYIY
jgi:hypothetical protein